MSLSEPGRTIPVRAPDTFRELLQRFATQSDVLAQEGRKLPDAPGARLKSILREIDETVLPRRIALTIAGRELACLDVSNRHLVALKQTAPDGLARDPDDAASADANRFAKCLLDIAKSEGSMSFEVAPRSGSIAETQGSCSVNLLRAALGLDGQACPIRHLGQLIGKVAVAQFAWISGPAGGIFSGEAAYRTLLETHAGRICDTAGTGGLPPDFRQERPEGLLIPVSQDKALILARAADRGIAAITQLQDALAVIETWQITCP